MADDKTEKHKAEIIEQLRKIPIIQIVVERVGIARCTFYRWKAEDKDFREKVNQATKEGRGLITDLAESQLINNIKNGNMTGIIFWLKNNDSRYSERQQLTESEVKQIVGLFDQLDKTEYEYQTLAKMILERKLPINVARIFNFLISAFSKAKNEKRNEERLRLIETVIK